MEILNIILYSCFVAVIGFASVMTVSGRTAPLFPTVANGAHFATGSAFLLAVAGNSGGSLLCQPFFVCWTRTFHANKTVLTFGLTTKGRS